MNTKNKNAKSKPISENIAPKSQNTEKYYYSEIEDNIIVNNILEDFKKRSKDRKPYL